MNEKTEWEKIGTNYYYTLGGEVVGILRMRLGDGCYEFNQRIFIDLDAAMREFERSELTMTAVARIKRERA